MRAFLLAVALVASPASAKTWKSADCSVGMVSGEKGFTILAMPNVDAPMPGDRHCKLGKWPLNTAVAELNCEDGSVAKVEFIDTTTAKLDGVLVYDDASKRDPEMCD